MEKRLSWIVIIIWISMCKTSAQWDSLPVKTKLVYSFSRGEQLKNINKEGESIEDVNRIFFKKIISISIDTVIYLKTGNRKLIFFLRCLDDIVFNEVSQIYTGIIKPDDHDKMHNIYGNPIVSKEDFKITSQQITTVYQFDSGIYFLTLPANFQKKIQEEADLVKKMDDALLKSVNDPNHYKYFTNGFIHLKNKNYPLRMVVLLKKRLTNTRIINEDPNNAFDYHYEFNAERLPFEEDSVKLVKKNSLINNADKYVVRSNKYEPFKTFYLSSKYGIVHSYSYAYDSKAGIRYVNILDLIRVIYPKKIK